MIFKSEIPNRFIKDKREKTFCAFVFLLAVCYLPVAAAAQTLAFLVPEKKAENRPVIEKLRSALEEKFKIPDDSMAEAAAESFSDINLFNLSSAEAKNLGKAIGCDFFIILKTETLRRAALSKLDYYESYAAFFLVSSRTGRLVFWQLSSFEAETAAAAEKKLRASIEKSASDISTNLKSSNEKEIAEINAPPHIPPVESTSKTFRPPIPYRRLKPAYTSLANLYGVAATVDALVDLDENGNVLKIEISRWAGYELDESVAETIRKMQWRAAELDGKPLPFRFLLRYNFKKLKNEEDENDRPLPE